MPFIHSTDVKLHPYRIDVVWPEQKQIGIIDSLFRNYYIPPIIFGEMPVFLSLSQPAQIFSKAVSTAEDGSESRVCIDGKQRLTSIQKCALHKSDCLVCLLFVPRFLDGLVSATVYSHTFRMQLLFRKHWLGGHWLSKIY